MSRRSRLIRALRRRVEHFARMERDRRTGPSFARLIAESDLGDVFAMRFVRNIRRWRG